MALRFYRRHAVAIFWIMIGIVYAIAIMPSPDAPDLGAGDKVNHIAAFLTLTLLGRRAYLGAPIWWLALGLSPFGAAIELTQAIPALNRDASIWDWIADSLAIIVMLAILLALEKRFPDRRAA